MKSLKIAVVTVLGACAALLVPATAEAAPQAVTMFSFKGEPGEPMSGGTSGVLREPAARFQLLQDRAISRFNITSGSDPWTVELAPPSGERFHPGVYLNAERAGFQHGRAAGLAVSHF